MSVSEAVGAAIAAVVKLSKDERMDLACTILETEGFGAQLWSWRDVLHYMEEERDLYGAWSDEERQEAAMAATRTEAWQDLGKVSDADRRIFAEALWQAALGEVRAA